MTKLQELITVHNKNRNNLDLNTTMYRGVAYSNVSHQVNKTDSSDLMYRGVAYSNVSHQVNKTGSSDLIYRGVKVQKNVLTEAK